MGALYCNADASSQSVLWLYSDISYSLPEQCDVKISIYNLFGERVATLDDGPREAGEHTATWDASKFPSGVYFARLETAE